MVAEDEVVAAEEGDSTHLTKGTLTFNKKTKAIEEPSEDRGACMPNKVGKQCHLPATFVGSSATTKKSVKR